MARRYRVMMPVLRPRPDAAGILARTVKGKPKPGFPRLFDHPIYRQRNIIVRMFGWLKGSRRFGTRYDKLARSEAVMTGTLVDILFPVGSGCRLYPIRPPELVHIVVVN